MSIPFTGNPTNVTASTVASMQISAAPTGGFGAVLKLSITNGGASSAYYLLHDSLTLPPDGDTNGVRVGPIAAGATLNVPLGADGFRFVRGTWVSKTSGSPPTRVGTWPAVVDSPATGLYAGTKLIGAADSNFDAWVIS